MMRQESPREGGARDDERKAIDLAVQRVNDGRRHAIAKQPSDRQRRHGQKRELAEQNERNLSASEAENAKAGQLPTPFGERHARRVVHDAERDDSRRRSTLRNIERFMLAASISLKFRITARLKLAPATAGSRFRRCDKPRLLIGVDQQRGARDDVAFAQHPVKGVDVNVRRQAEDVVDEAHDR